MSSRVRAVVFDFDGLILDTEGPVFVAWQEAFVAYGCGPLTVDEWAAEIGTVRGLDIIAIMQTRATRPLDVEAMHEQRRLRRDELLAAEVVRPGVHAWLDEARELQIEVAIASSSPRAWVEEHLDRLGLRERFAHVACFAPGVAAKPAPDTYLAACRAIGVDPVDALAVEDSPHGVQAAKSAGLRCVAVPNAITRQLDLAHADVQLESLAHASLRDLIADLDGSRTD